MRTGLQRQARAATLALANNSRMLGITERGKTPSAVWQFLFGVTPDPEGVPDDAPQVIKEWRAMQDEARQVRPELIKLLQYTCGCFQGGGKTALGVDIFQIIENYPSATDRLEVSKFENISPELKVTLGNLSDVRVKAKTKNVLVEVGKLKCTLDLQLGVDPNKDAIASGMKELAETFRELGAWIENDIGVTAGQFRTLCEEFRTCALKDAFAQLDKTGDSDDSEGGIKVVSRIAQLTIVPILVAVRFVNCANKVIGSAQRHAQSVEGQYLGVDPVAQANAIQKAFVDLANSITILQQGEA